MSVPLIAQVEDSTTGVTGLGLVEDAELIASGIRDGSWVDGVLGGVGASLDGLALAVDPIGTLTAWGVAWLIEHVRPLQDALDWLAGNADEVAAQAATWANIAAFTGTVREEFAGRVEVEVARWFGASADAYRLHASDHLTVLHGVGAAAGGISCAVEGAGLLVGLVRGIVRDLIAQFIATLAIRIPQWLAMEGLSLGVATPLVAGQVATLVARCVNEIQHFVRALLNSLRRLLPDIESLSKILDQLRMLTDRLARSSPTSGPGSPHGAGPLSGSGSGAGVTPPSKPPDPGRAPRGGRTAAHPTRSKDSGLRRENEAADVLAQHGYDVEQNPPGKSNRKNPDYRIEGRYFDCYAPRTGNIDNLRKAMSTKVHEEQSDRLVINMQDTSCTTEEVADMLERKPIQDLKEVVAVLDNQVIVLYPPGA